MFYLMSTITCMIFFLQNTMKWNGNKNAGTYFINMARYLFIGIYKSVLFYYECKCTII